MNFRLPIRNRSDVNEPLLLNSADLSVLSVPATRTPSVATRTLMDRDGVDKGVDLRPKTSVTTSCRGSPGRTCRPGTSCEGAAYHHPAAARGKSPQNQTFFFWHLHFNLWFKYCTNCCVQVLNFTVKSKFLFLDILHKSRAVLNAATWKYVPSWYTHLFIVIDTSNVTFIFVQIMSFVIMITLVIKLLTY